MSAVQPHQKTVAKPHRKRVRTARSKGDERHFVGEQPEYLELCSTCRHVSTCTVPRSEDRPVHQCEEFDGEEDEPALTVVYHEDVLDEKVPAGGEKYPGICATCAILDTCTFPKPEGGVWRCEEFE